MTDQTKEYLKVHVAVTGLITAIALTAVVERNMHGLATSHASTKVSNPREPCGAVIARSHEYYLAPPPISVASFSNR